MKLDRLSTPSLCAVYLTARQVLADSQEAIDGGREYFRQLLAEGGVTDDDRDAQLRRPGSDLVVKPYENTLNDRLLREPFEALRYEAAKRPVNVFTDAYNRLLSATDRGRGVEDAERWFNYVARGLSIHTHEVESVLTERLDICSVRETAEAHLVQGIAPQEATTSDLARAVLTEDLESKLDAPRARSIGPKLGF